MLDTVKHVVDDTFIFQQDSDWCIA